MTRAGGLRKLAANADPQDLNAGIDLEMDGVFCGGAFASGSNVDHRVSANIELPPDVDGDSPIATGEDFPEHGDLGFENDSNILVLRPCGCSKDCCKKLVKIKQLPVLREEVADPMMFFQW